MRTVGFYHKQTGLLNGDSLITSDDAAVALNTPVDHIAIDGSHDHLSMRVDISTGELIDYKPPPPSMDHQWDEVTRRWKLNAVAADRLARKVAAGLRIAQLESTQHRAIREHALGFSGAPARLKAIDDEIASLRSHL